MLDFYYFEWDPQKARTNLIKHGISFDSASTVFHDPNMISLFDELHSDEEERWISIGLDEETRTLVVVHTINEFENESWNVRIISARKATEREKQTYYEGI